MVYVLGVWGAVTRVSQVSFSATDFHGVFDPYLCEALSFPVNGALGPPMPPSVLGGLHHSFFTNIMPDPAWTRSWHAGTPSR